MLQILGANEVLGKEVGAPIATQAELDDIARRAENVTTIARDLEELLKRARPAGD